MSLLAILGTILAVASIAWIGCIIGATKKGASRGARMFFGTLAVAPILLLAIICSPFLIQNVGYHWFGDHLTVGMRRDQVDALRRSTFGADRGTLNSRLDDRFSSAENVAHVWYTTVVIPCYASGKVYRLDFDEKGRLQYWRPADWADGC
jgi:hypothetical protein